MNSWKLATARGLLRHRRFLPTYFQILLRSHVKRAENSFVLQRAKTWKLDAQGRLEWIDGMYEMIQMAKKNYNENIQ